MKKKAWRNSRPLYFIWSPDVSISNFDFYRDQADYVFIGDMLVIDLPLYFGWGNLIAAEALGTVVPLAAQGAAGFIEDQRATSVRA